VRGQAVFRIIASIFHNHKIVIVGIKICCSVLKYLVSVCFMLTYKFWIGLNANASPVALAKVLTHAQKVRRSATDLYNATLVTVIRKKIISYKFISKIFSIKAFTNSKIFNKVIPVIM
jgi:hypothetical protein